MINLSAFLLSDLEGAIDPILAPAMIVIALLRPPMAAAAAPAGPSANVEPAP